MGEEIILKISSLSEEFTPETASVAVLADYLKAFAQDLSDLKIAAKDIHLKEIKSGSCCLVFGAPEFVAEACAEMARTGGKRLKRLLLKNQHHAALQTAGAVYTIPQEEAAARYEIHDAAFYEGELLGLKGYKEGHYVAWLGINPREVLRLRLVDEALARALVPHWKQRVCLSGYGLLSFNPADFSARPHPKHFLIQSFKALEACDYKAELEALRGIKTRWQEIDNPLEVAEEIRYGAAL